MSDCIYWTGAKFNHGYGQIRRKGKLHLAHRYLFEQAYGPIPFGMVVRHKCDDKRCVNLEHLELGSQRDNVLDRTTRGRDHNKNKTHCKHGHEYNEANTYYSKQGKRHCKKCAAQRARVRRGTV